jgi:uncharacterized protein with von Willebrand factor type A (vWA) domain
MYPFATLPENLAAFCRILRRRHGFRIGAGELRDAARVLDVVSLANEAAVRHALRAVLSGTREQAALFDRAFAAFFFPGPAGLRPDEMPSTRREPGSAERTRRRATDVPSHSHPDADAHEPSGLGSGPMTRSRRLTARRKRHRCSRHRATARGPSPAVERDRRSTRGGEAVGRDPAAQTFVRRLHLGLSRRWRPAARGRRFDLRRTLRASLQTGGEALAPRWLRRPRRTPRFVLLVDGSRSMSEHARTALQIAVAMAGVTMRLEVFTFSTELGRVTHEVRRAAAGESCRLQDMHRTWAGGTSIGECLRDFLRRFGGSLLGRDTVVMIASDGLDVGAWETLRNAMRELHRRSAAVVWINPLLDTPGYEPTASGMRAAKPFLDTFASVADAPALARLSSAGSAYGHELSSSQGSTLSVGGRALSVER